MPAFQPIAVPSLRLGKKKLMWAMLAEKLPPPRPHSSAMTTNTVKLVSGFCTASDIHRVGTSRVSVLKMVKLRPPKMGTTKEYSKRNSAPEIPGAAASQNNCPVVNSKPIRGSSTTTTDHSIQTANDRNSGGIENTRLRMATALPPARQNSSSSGRQLLIQRPAVVTGRASSSLTSSSRSPGRRASTSSRSPRSASQVQIMTRASTPNISMKVVLRTPVASTAAPNMMGNEKPPRPPITPTRPPTVPMFPE